MRQACEAILRKVYSTDRTNRETQTENRPAKEVWNNMDRNID